MRTVRLLSLVFLAAPLLAQAPECPQTSAEQRRIAEEAIRAPAARALIPEGRTRVLHVYCTETGKEPRRSVLVSVLYNYSANVAMRATLDPGSRRMVAAERMVGRPQTSAEERQEAFGLVRELASNGVLEGGFVVDPPEGAPAAGRYVLVQILSPDRWKLQETVIVDLSRGKVVARRRP